MQKIRMIAVLFLSLSAGQWCEAKDGGVTLNGSVRDQTGAIIQNATVTLIPLLSGAARKARSDDRGYFIWVRLYWNGR